MHLVVFKQVSLSLLGTTPNSDGWPDCQERNAWKPHCTHTITIRKMFVVMAARHRGQGGCYKEKALSRRKWRDKQRDNIQHRAPKTILKYYYEFYLLTKNTFTITSLIHLRNHALCAWTQVHTMRIRTSTCYRDFRQSSLQFGRALFNPHLPGAFLFLWTGRYRLPGAEIFEHRWTTIRGVYRGVVIWRRGVIYLYRGDGLWYHFRLVALAMLVQEVES